MSRTRNLSDLLDLNGDVKAGALDNVESFTKSASDPAIDTNGTLGDVWVNTTSGQMYVLTNATTDANIWTNIGDGSGTIPGPYSVEYLIVAGGGAGGCRHAGGGGAGGYVSSSSSVTTGESYTVTIGGGGAGSDGSAEEVGANGSDSSFLASTAIGGGGGGAPGGYGNDGG